MLEHFSITAGTSRVRAVLVENFMDLVVEVLPQDQNTGAMVLSLAHYFEQHGDLCQDPEMVVRVFPPRGVAPEPQGAGASARF